MSVNTHDLRRHHLNHELVPAEENLNRIETTGHWKAGHRPCVSLSQASVGRMLHCHREKAAGLFAALEACGLLQPVPGQPNGKARRYYMNLPRPKEPNEL